VDYLNRVYESPADSRVASLLGEINLFGGKVADGRFIGDAFQLDLGSKARGKVMLGIRPEDVRVQEGKGLLSLGQFSVVLSSYQGGAFRITASKGRETLVFISDVPYKVGQTLDLYVVRGRMKLFDEAGEFLETV